MFKKEEDILILENDSIKYDFLNNPEDYKKIIILLTDPQKDVTINLEIDEGLSESEINLCKNYKEFIEKFLEKREDYLNGENDLLIDASNEDLPSYDELPF